MKEYYWKGKAISDMDNPTLVLCCNGISHWVNQMGDSYRLYQTLAIALTRYGGSWFKQTTCSGLVVRPRVSSVCKII